jgi:hypothetical protein
MDPAATIRRGDFVAWAGGCGFIGEGGASALPMNGPLSTRIRAQRDHLG